MDYDYKIMIATLRNKLILFKEEFAKFLDTYFVSVNRWKIEHEPNIKIKKKMEE